MWIFWEYLIFRIFGEYGFLDDLGNLDASLSRFLAQLVIGCLQRKIKGIKVEKLLFIILEPLRPLDTSPINRGGVMPPPPASRIAFGDLLVAWHIPSKLGSALNPVSVPPINRGRIWCVDYVLVCFLELNRILKRGMLRGVFFLCGYSGNT